ncbi:hypothetical protein [Mycolicibacterium sp.]|uniref:hypothetical protein n=1 Tax=Mycolicibacterium sp. TaxID=2320850 RepID=UPI0037C69CC3
MTSPHNANAATTASTVLTDEAEACNQTISLIVAKANATTIAHPAATANALISRSPRGSSSEIFIT